jgi:hypothetical protein
MGDLAKSLTSGRLFQGVIYGWLVPLLMSSLTYLLFASEVLQGSWLDEDITRIRESIGASEFLFFIGSCFLVALFMHLAMRSVYRIFEGYTFWPRRFALRGIQRQAAWKWYIDSLFYANESTESPEVRAKWLKYAESARSRLARPNPFTAFRLRSLSRDELLVARLHHRYPNLELSLCEELAKGEGLASKFAHALSPTAAGNILRRIEDYGLDTYELDTQRLWFELVAVTDQTSRESLVDARYNADFYIASSMSFSALAVVSAITASMSDSVGMLIPVLIGVFLGVAMYRGWLSALDEWGYVVQAVVNTGRLPLASKLGLDLPRTLEAEREMWTGVRAFSAHRGSGWGKTLDRFRRAQQSSPLASPSSEASDGGTKEVDEAH